jgi:hypothetical protein
MGNPRASVSKQRRVTRYSIVSEVQTHVHLQTFKLKIPRIIKRWKDKSTNICNIDASLVQLLCFLSTTSTSKRSASAFSSGGAVHAPTILMLGYGIKLSFGRMFRFVLSLSLLTRLLLARDVSVCLSLSLLTRLVFGREVSLCSDLLKCLFLTKVIGHNWLHFTTTGGLELPKAPFFSLLSH